MSPKCDIAEIKKYLEERFPENVIFRKAQSRFGYLWAGIKRKTSEGVLEEFITDGRKEIDLTSRCRFCGDVSEMKIDFLYAGKQKGPKITPNFRERLVCPQCGLNNRLRATYHLLETLCPDLKDKKIYITEETTPFFVRLREKCPALVGSEYFAGDSRKKVFIEDLKREFNNENLTDLSFSDEEFHLVVSCDVLEHVPDYKKALKEIYRVLKEDSYFVFSVPFIPSNKKTVVRAKIVNGKTENILPAEYHGDPVNPEGGCLCFYHFGWDLMKELKKIGFKKSGIYLYNSPRYGYLGQGTMLYAKK